MHNWISMNRSYFDADLVDIDDCAKHAQELLDQHTDETSLDEWTDENGHTNFTVDLDSFSF